jgi:hypothetical protein
MLLRFLQRYRSTIPAEGEWKHAQTQSDRRKWLGVPEMSRSTLFSGLHAASPRKNHSLPEVQFLWQTDDYVGTACRHGSRQATPFQRC